MLVSNTLLVFLALFTINCCALTQESFRHKRQVKISQIRLDSWSNCQTQNGGEWPLHLKNLYLTKNPVTVPGGVTVKLEVKFNRNIDSFVSARVHMMRDFGILRNIAIPCFNVNGNSLGSCRYENICSKSLLSDYVKCDTFGICKCRVPAKEEPYSLLFNLEIPNPPGIRRQIDAKGTYKLTVKFFEEDEPTNESPLMCLKATAIVD